MLTPDVFWLPFSCAHGEGQAKVFKLQHSLSLHTSLPSSLHPGRRERSPRGTDFGSMVDFSCIVEVRGMGTVVSQKF